jgi:hypothetical protein
MDEMTVVHPLELVVLPLTLAGITIPVRLKPSWSHACATRNSRLLRAES